MCRVLDRVVKRWRYPGHHQKMQAVWLNYMVRNLEFDVFCLENDSGVADSVTTHH